ncbi:hypothetical protein AMECASPLE_017134 [Ameca splendens]|uniref:Chemokine interleukin-8-like domain-containing protein n=1 Tax=Ameca splendens TaxID=208324 RepID=A0ABV0ZP07_9TELE
MWTAFTIKGKIFLPILVVWILLSVSVASNFVHPACCHQGSEKVNGKIHQCFEQRPGKPCHKHFFLLDIEGKPPLCINPDSEWLRSKMKTEHLKCPPADKHRE